MVPGGPASIVVTAPDMNEFVCEPHALFLWLTIRLAHGMEPSKEFALDQRELARMLRCGTRKVSMVIKDLIKRKKIELVYKGGRHIGDASRYRIKSA